MLRLFKPGNANGIIVYQWIDIKIGKKRTDAALRLFNLLTTVFFLFCFVFAVEERDVRYL